MQTGIMPTLLFLLYSICRTVSGWPIILLWCTPCCMTRSLVSDFCRMSTASFTQCLMSRQQ